MCRFVRCQTQVGFCLEVEFNSSARVATYSAFVFIFISFSQIMRESAFYVCENKGPDQLSGSHKSIWLLNGCRVNNNFMYIYPAAMYIAELALEWLPCI